MSRIFVSHASADSELVDTFVDRLLRNGTNLAPDEIFYSSGEDTGILSGEDLIAAVRREVGDATLVVALITPTYQTRPVCIAELGAAWSRAGHLMPLLVPGTPRTDLDGVLEGMTIRPMDDSAALDELHDRVKEAVGKEVRAATWSRHKQQWLKEVAVLAEGVPTPPIVSVADLDQARRDLEGAQAALGELEDENRDLRRQRDALKLLKDADQVAEALLSPDERSRFEQLVDALEATVNDLDPIVVDTLWAQRFDRGLPYPWQDDYKAAQADQNVANGLLTRDADEILWPDDDSGAIVRAQAARDRLQTFLVEESSEEFGDWFREEYDFGPDLKRKSVWDQLL